MQLQDRKRKYDQHYKNTESMKNLEVKSLLKNPIVSSLKVDEFGKGHLLKEIHYRDIGRVVDDSNRFITKDENGVIYKDDRSEQMVAVVLDENARKVDDFAFSKCEALEYFKANSGLKSIGRGAFNECYKLKYVELNDGLEEIGSKAFYDCNNLYQARIKIPGSVKKFGKCVFQNSAIKEIYTTKEVAELYIKTNTDTVGIDIFAVDDDKLYVYRILNNSGKTRKVVRRTYDWLYKEEDISRIYSYGISDLKLKGQNINRIETHVLDRNGNWVLEKSRRKPVAPVEEELLTEEIEEINEINEDENKRTK